MKHLTLGMILFLSGCATTSTSEWRPWRVHPLSAGPDGGKNWAVITCVQAVENCYEAASRACPGGYEVHTDMDHTTHSTDTRGAAIFGSTFRNDHAHSDDQEHFRQEWLISCNSTRVNVGERPNLIPNE